MINVHSARFFWCFLLLNLVLVRSAIAQCTINPQCPDCPAGAGTFSGNASVTVNNNSGANNLSQCSSGNATIPNLNINNDLPGNVTLVFGHDATIGNINFNNNNAARTITIVVHSGVTLTVNGMTNLPRNIRFITCNNATMDINANVNINGEGFFLGNYGGTFNVNGTGGNGHFNITSSGAIIENTGLINTNRLTINSSNTNIRMGNGGTWNTNRLSANNTNNPFCVPPNQCAAFNISGPVDNANNPLTSSNDLLFCASDPTAAAYMDQNNRTGSATVGCPASCNVTTPISLLSFTGKWEGDHIRLQWQTLWERDHDFFALDYSPDGVSFNEVTRLSGAPNGNTTSLKAYTFLHTLVPPNQYHYYRLRDVSTLGEVSTSKIIVVKTPETQRTLVLVSNPVRENRLEIMLASNTQHKFTVRDIHGRQVLPKHAENAGGVVRIDVTSLLPGIYLLYYQNEQGIGCERFVLSR